MMRIRWLAAAAAALAVVLAVAQVSVGRRSPTPTVRVGVALYDQTDTFLSTLTQHLEEMFREEEQQRGIKINLSLADGRGSQSVQNEQVDRFLDLGYDVICVNLVDRTAAAVIVDKAQEAGVPVIFFNREPVEEDLFRWDGVYYVGSPGEEAGRLQGMLVLSAWRANADALDRNGDGVVQYVMLEGEPGHQDALLRTEYSVQTLVTGGVPVEKLDSAAANWQRSQAAERMRQWLQTLDGQIEVVFANNDDMALGAIDACLEAEMTAEDMPFIVGVDATPPALDALRAGTLRGTVRNDARGQAENIVALGCALAEGTDPARAVELEAGKYVWLSYTTVTAADVRTGQPR